MYEQAFALSIIAPNRVVFQGEATSVSVAGTKGGFQVLFNHAPLLSSLRVGPLRVRDTAGVETLYATGGGFIEVRNNAVVVLLESAELIHDIDVDRAVAARQRAEDRLRSRDASVDVARAEAALARSLNRIHLAKKK